MPVLLKSSEDHKSVLAEKRRVELLDASVLNSDFCEVSLVLIDPEQPFVDHIGSDDLVWFQVLRGSGTVGEYKIDASSIGFAGTMSPFCNQSMTPERGSTFRHRNSLGPVRSRQRLFPIRRVLRLQNITTKGRNISSMYCRVLERRPRRGVACVESWRYSV
jgi:hypothetical protein